jgi:hypothetical protein
MKSSASVFLTYKKVFCKLRHESSPVTWMNLVLRRGVTIAAPQVTIGLLGAGIDGSWTD